MLLKAGWSQLEFHNFFFKNKMDKTSFLDFYDKNLAYLGEPEFQPDMSIWFDKHEKSHERLRKKLNGNSICVNVKSNLEPSKAVSYLKICEHAEALGSLIPEYFADYSFSISYLQYFRVPSGPQEGTGWGVHISYWMKRNVTSSETRRLVDVQLSLLGQIYAEEEKSLTKDLHVHITTEPTDFVLLGNTQLDVGSCFKQKGANVSHKFILGQTEDTFVGYISYSENIEDIESHIIRFWGVFDSVNNIVIISNRYFNSNNYDIAKRIPVNNVVEKVAQALLETETAYPFNGIVDAGDVWKNGDCKVFTKDKNDDIDILRINTDPSGFEQYRKCGRCYRFGDLKYKGEGSWHFCEKCAKDANLKQCERSGLWTFQALYQAFSDETISEHVCNQVLEREFSKCNYTGKWFLKKLIVINSNNYPMSIYFAKDKYHKCDRCPKWISNEETKCSCGHESSNKLVEACKD